MNFAEKAFRWTLRRLIMIQSILIIGIALIFIFEQDIGFVLAIVYGGAVSISVTLIRAWRLKVATEVADNATYLPKIEADTKTVGVNAAQLYKGFALGYFVAIALLALGLGILKLVPLALLTGFVAAQLGHFFVRPPKPGAGRV